MKTSLAALVALALLAAGPAVAQAGAPSPAVGHCVVIYPIYVGGQQITDTYEVCIPV